MLSILPANEREVEKLSATIFSGKKPRFRSEAIPAMAKYKEPDRYILHTVADPFMPFPLYVTLLSAATTKPSLPLIPMRVVASMVVEDMIRKRQIFNMVLSGRPHSILQHSPA